MRRRVSALLAGLLALALGLTSRSAAAAPRSDALFPVAVEPASEEQVAAIWRLAEQVIEPHDPGPGRHLLLISRPTADRLAARGITLRAPGPAADSLGSLGSAGAPATRALGSTLPGRLGVFDGWWGQVQDLAAVNRRLGELALASRGRARVVTLGRSIEGRPIQGLRILAGGAPADETITRAAILVTGTHHAREWASPMVTMGIAEALVRQYLVDPRVRRVVNTLAVFVVPVVNVDGYVATHTGQRLLRKNMNPRCPVDLNRNYDVAFGLGAPAGGCAEESYPGPHPFSEPETRAIKDLADSLPNLQLFLDYHAPAEQVMIPFAHTRARPDGFEASAARAQLYADTLRSLHGTLHPAREGFDLAQGQGGGAIDWFRTSGRESFAIELRDGREVAGFGLPPEQIIPTAEENWTAFLALGLALAAEHPLPGGPHPEAILDGGTETLLPGASSAPLGCQLAGGPSASGLPLALLPPVALFRRRRR